MIKKRNVISHQQKKLAGVLVAAGLTLSQTAEISGVSVRSVKRWYKAHKPNRSKKLKSMDKLFILFDLLKGTDFTKTSARLNLSPRKILSYLQDLNQKDIKIQKCANCQNIFLAEEIQRLCPFCLVARKL